MEAIEYAFPFDAEELPDGEYDRVYIADDFARYFRAFISSGIISDEGELSTNLQLVANSDMTTTLKAGNLIISGYRYSGDSQLKEIVKKLENFEVASENDFLEWFERLRAFVESSQNGELLLRIEAIFNEMFALVTDDDIDEMIAGKYEKEETGSLFEITSEADIDAIIEGTYELQPEDNNGIPEGGE